MASQRCNVGTLVFLGYGTGIEEESSSSVDNFLMTLSEMPTTGIFSVLVTLPSASQVAINLYDTTGRLIESSETPCQSGLNSIQMNISDNPEGMYFVTASVNDIFLTSTVIKTN